MTTRPPRPLRLTVLGVGRRVLSGLFEHSAFEAAAAVAFWFFLSLVPLLVLLGFLIGHVARTRGVDALAGPLLDVVPDAAEDIVRKELDRLAGNAASSLAPLGVAGYFWTASSGLHNLMDVFETGLKAKRRPWWKKRAIALSWVAVGLMCACALAWSLVKVDGIIQRVDRGSQAHLSTVSEPPAPSARGAERTRATPPDPSHPKTLKHHIRKAFDTAEEKGIAAVMVSLVGMALLAGFYRFAVAHPPGTTRRVWPGTFAAVASFLVVSWVFGAYVGSIGNYALYYGSLAAVAVLLVWLYLASLSLIIGAELNVELEGGRGE